MGTSSGVMEHLGMTFVEMSYLMSEECFLIWLEIRHCDSLRIEHESGTGKV